MRQLQTRSQIIVCIRAEARSMSRYQLFTQRRNRRLRARRHQQLVRVGAAVVADGHRFSAPHQLGAARAEIPPAAVRQVARLALARAVPSFHGKNAEAVADAYSVHLKRSRERRSWRLRALIVKRDVDVVAPE